jgi:hypothetical protein
MGIREGERVAEVLTIDAKGEGDESWHERCVGHAVKLEGDIPFILHGILPPSPLASVDLMLEARQDDESGAMAARVFA